MAITEGEDPDDEDNLPIPATRDSALGKTRVQASTSIHDWSEDEDDDDCHILDPIDATPDCLCSPLPSDPVNPAGPSQKTRKRAEAGTSDTRASAASDLGSERPMKLQKKAAQRRPKKTPPTMVG